MLSLLVLLIFSQNSFCQQETDLRELFLAAESYYLFEEFNEALPLYLRIHRHFPENDNINFKIGVCFLNNPYEKDKSIRYLEEAVQNINPKYKENNFKETGAPLESLFYLGNAYRVNNQLSKARDYYNLFMTKMDPEVYDSELVQEQLDACDAAESLIKKPVDFDVTNLSDKINTRFADMNPVISGDESKMAFISKLQFYDAVFYTEKVNGEWTPPRNIIPELGVDGDVYPTSMSYNGTEMFVYRNDDYIGNLYVTRFVNNKWTPLVKLGDNINTKYWESHASISKDGKTLYFSSNRKGGYGGLDIYRSERQKDGKWGPAVNIGPVINSKYNDDTPFISQEGDRIYFSSYGHYSMGGYDIFMSKKVSDTTWAKPLNLGYPINTTDDDQFFVPVYNGNVGYYSRFTDQGFGRHDIFRYVVYNADNPRMFNIQGLIDFMGETARPEEIAINVLDKVSRDTLASTQPNQEGIFNFSVPAGSYNVIFDSEKFKKHILNLEVPADSPHEGFSLENPIALELSPVIIPPKDISEYLKLRVDTLITVSDDEPVNIKYNAEQGTIADIMVKNGDKLIYFDSLIIEKKRQSFEFIPEPGINEVKITLRDQDGNKTSQTINVIREFPEKEISEQIDPAEVTGPVGDENIETVRPPVPDEKTEAEILRELLIENSEGPLKEYLENLSPADQNLETEKDLIDYLKNAEPENEFSESDIIKALDDSGKLNDVKEWVEGLSGNTTNKALKEVLVNLDHEKEGITGNRELLDYLYEKSETNDFSQEDVDQMVESFYNEAELIKAYEKLKDLSEGNLKEYLENLDLEKEGITDFASLIDHLLENAEENGFTTKDVYDLIQKYLESNDINSKKNLVNQLRSDEKAASLLEELSEEQIMNMSESDLILYLFKKADEKGISEEELIISILLETNPNVEKLKEGLNLTASPELKEYLNQLKDPPADAIELFRNLIEKAKTSDSFTVKDVTSAFREYLENMEILDYINTMKKYASGDLLEVLENLNPLKEGITTRKELIDYLNREAINYSYTEDDVYQAATAADNELYFSSLVDILIELAEGGLKQALIDLKNSGRNITGIDELIDYLMENRIKYGYSTTDIFELLEKLGDEIQLSPVSKFEKDPDEQRIKFNQGALKTGLILLGEGLIILILIIFARRKKKKD